MAIVFRISTFVFATLVLCGAASAGLFDKLTGGDELLDPTEAFAVSVEQETNGELTVSFDIQPGYYLYRKSLSVRSLPSELLGQPSLPAGKTKSDQFFGESEIYRDELDFAVPVVNKSFSGDLQVLVRSQGCADIGVCYPPEEAKFNVTLAATKVAAGTLSGELPQSSPSASNTASNLAGPASTSGSGQSSSLFGGLSSLTSQTQSDVLSPEQAFVPSLQTMSDGQLQVTWTIEPGHYLYKHKYAFELENAEETQIQQIRISDGIEKTDQFFGDVEVHREQSTALLTLAGNPGGKTGDLKLSYQGCADIGICYPVTETSLPFTVVLAAASDGMNTGNATGIGTTVSALTESENRVPQAQQDRLAAQLGSGNRWLTIATFFGLGLLLTFTPCVLPMVPILSSIIVGDGEQTSTRRAFALSLVYVLAMAVTYTVAGVVVGLSGENVQAALQHPYVIGATAALFVLLSLSMFGAYELQLPGFLQQRLMAVSGKQSGGRFPGVAAMGVLSALIVGPCITAPLVGALIYIAQTGDAVLGGAALFALSMGMGLPLLLIGTSFGKLLPRAGGWMDSIKVLFGFLLLAMAVWMLDRIAPAWLIMLLAALLLICVGMSLRYWQQSTVPKPVQVVSTAAGYAALVYGTLLIVGLATGSGSITQPLAGLSVAQGLGQDNTSAKLAFKKVSSVEALNAQLAQAAASDQPVMLDFYADWCVSCKEMEAFTFTDSDVQSLLKPALLLKVDVTQNTDDDKALLDKYGLFGPPATIFYNGEGVEQRNNRVMGFLAAKEFADVIRHNIY